MLRSTYWNPSAGIDATSPIFPWKKKARVRFRSFISNNRETLPPQEKKNMNSGSTAMTHLAQCRLPGAERSAPHAQDLGASAVGNGFRERIEQCQDDPKSKEPGGG